MIELAHYGRPLGRKVIGGDNHTLCITKEYCSSLCISSVQDCRCSELLLNNFTVEQTQHVSAPQTVSFQPEARFSSAVIKITIFSPISYNFTKSLGEHLLCRQKANHEDLACKTASHITRESLNLVARMIKKEVSVEKKGRPWAKITEVHQNSEKCQLRRPRLGIVRRTNRPNLILPFSLSCFIGFILTYLQLWELFPAVNLWVFTGYAWGGEDHNGGRWKQWISDTSERYL